MWHFGFVKSLHLNNITKNKDVFVGCSEISISVIVKDKENIGIIRTFYQL